MFENSNSEKVFNSSRLSIANAPTTFGVGGNQTFLQEPLPQLRIISPTLCIKKFLWVLLLPFKVSSKMFHTLLPATFSFESLSTKEATGLRRMRAEMFVTPILVFHHSRLWDASVLRFAVFIVGADGVIRHQGRAIMHPTDVLREEIFPVEIVVNWIS
jgi:hypothetical protein